MRLPKLPDSCTVFTPEPLANAMVHAIGNQPDDLWLEPCVGQGALTSALKKMGVPKNRIIAVDLAESRSPNDSNAKTLRGTEFLAWSLKSRHRFNKVVANPPYINLDQSDPMIRKSARQIKGVDGEFIRDGSNCWAAFLSACLNLLKPGGSLCFLLPAAWDYANYATSIRNLLPNQFESFEIHRSRDPLFDSVRDGCVVIVGRGYKEKHSETSRYEYESSVDFVNGLSGKSIATRNAHKIIPISENLNAGDDEKTCTLAEIMDIRLGGVTGDSKYFLLTEQRRIELGLPTECLRPVLSKSRHLVSSEITRKEWDRFRDQMERIWLFDPPPRMLKHPAVHSYLTRPSKLGGCNKERTKIKERNLWYRIVLPQQVDGFISGMGKLGPWIAFRQMPHLTATSTLYTIQFKERLTRDQKAAWALSLLALRGKKSIKNAARIYPEGLEKFEPSDLLNLKVTRIPKCVKGAQRTYKKAIDLLNKGHLQECEKLVEEWFNARQLE